MPVQGCQERRQPGHVGEGPQAHDPTHAGQARRGLALDHHRPGRPGAPVMELGSPRAGEHLGRAPQLVERRRLLDVQRAPGQTSLQA